MQAIESVALSKESNDITLVYTSRIENAISQLLPLTEKLKQTAGQSVLYALSFFRETAIR